MLWSGRDKNVGGDVMRVHRSFTTSLSCTHFPLATCKCVNCAKGDDVNYNSEPFAYDLWVYYEAAVDAGRRFQWKLRRNRNWPFSLVSCLFALRRKRCHRKNIRFWVELEKKKKKRNVLANFGIDRQIEYWIAVNVWPESDIVVWLQNRNVFAAIFINCIEQQWKNWRDPCMPKAQRTASTASGRLSAERRWKTRVRFGMESGDGEMVIRTYDGEAERWLCKTNGFKVQKSCQCIGGDSLYRHMLHS